MIEFTIRVEVTDNNDNLNFERLRERLQACLEHATTKESMEEALNCSLKLTAGYNPNIAVCEDRCRQLSDMEYRVKLVCEVLDRVVGSTSTILSEAGDLGGQLAYLLGAICNTNIHHPRIELEEEDDVLDAFRKVFPEDHQVWQFIEVMNGDGDAETRCDSEQDADAEGLSNAAEDAEIAKAEEDHDRRRGLYGPEYPGENF